MIYVNADGSVGTSSRFVDLVKRKQKDCFRQSAIYYPSINYFQVSEVYICTFNNEQEGGILLTVKFVPYNLVLDIYL